MTTPSEDLAHIYKLQLVSGIQELREKREGKSIITLESNELKHLKILHIPKPQYSFLQYE